MHQCEKCEKVFATGSGYKYHVRRSVCEQECEKGSPLPTHKHTNFSVFNTFFQMVPKCFSVRCVWKCSPPTPVWPTTSKGRCANRCKRKKVSVVPTRGGTDLECCRGRGDPVRHVRNGVQASDLVALPSHSQCLHQTQKRYHSVSLSTFLYLPSNSIEYHLFVYHFLLCGNLNHFD